jgi:hypothetical protein
MIIFFATGGETQQQQVLAINGFHFESSYIPHIP